MSGVIISGGTGLVGRALSRHLVQCGYGVTVLCRSIPKNQIQGIEYSVWNPDRGEIDAAIFRDAECLIHLAGAGVAEKRWTKARKKLIADSRIKSGELLMELLRSKPNRIQTVISASAVGWYGPDKGIPFQETDPANDDFLGTTCRLWEESMYPAEKLGMRLVFLRLGFVLTPEGGALAEFIKPVRFGIVPILGSGNQMISWIHIQDLCRMFEWAMEKTELRGPYNAVSPQPVSNKTLMLCLAKQVRGRIYIPIHVPSLLLKIMLGEMSIEVLKSTTVCSQKIQTSGFQFRYTEISNALKSLIDNQ
jgi:uncharacterized protein (TIGR01777 family)